jgi:hypothetical protein
MLRTKPSTDALKKSPCKRSFQRYYPQATDQKSPPKFNVKEVIEIGEIQYTPYEESVEESYQTESNSIKFELNETIPDSILKSSAPRRLPSSTEIVVEDLDVNDVKIVEDESTFLTSVTLQDQPAPINFSKLVIDPRIQSIIDYVPPASPIRERAAENIPHVLEILTVHMSEKERYMLTCLILIERKMVASEVSTTSTLAAHKPARKQTVATRSRVSPDSFRKSEVTKYSEKSKKILELELRDVVSTASMTAVASATASTRSLTFSR